MPMYLWRDRRTQKSIEILRDHKEYRTPPTVEEATSLGLTEEEAKDADWQKLISRGIRMAKSDTWGPGKGHW